MIYLVLFSFLWLCASVILLISAVLGPHSTYFFSGIFHASCTVLFFLLVLFFLARLHSLLKINVLNSWVGDT